MRTVGVVTSSRADYGLYRPVLRAMSADSELAPRLFVTGTHLMAEHGMTIRWIEEDGFPIAERIDALLYSDSPEGVAKSMGRGTLGFGEALARTPVDLLMVLGDRFEMHAAAVAALPFKIPVAHLHGGEVTFGAIDDSLRHSMTKLSHLHFATTEEHARRIRQLGEEDWRVHVTGAPGLDNLRDFRPLSPEAFESEFGFPLTDDFLLVTFHPVTLEYERTANYCAALLEALEAAGRPVLFTRANADTHGHIVNAMIETFSERIAAWRLVDNLGTDGYFTALGRAAAVVGNSSSGIIEAASFKVPVVNIGTRQEGRLHPANVMDVGYAASDITSGLARALSPAFRESLAGLVNPYGDGHAAERIVRVLKETPLGDRLIRKRFVDLNSGKGAG